MSIDLCSQLHHGLRRLFTADDENKVLSKLGAFVRGHRLAQRLDCARIVSVVLRISTQRERTALNGVHCDAHSARDHQLARVHRRLCLLPHEHLRSDCSEERE